MICKYEEYIGIYQEIIPVKLCHDFITWFDTLSKEGITISSNIDASGLASTSRKDEVVQIPSGLSIHCFPQGLCKELWEKITECVKLYLDEYNFNDPVTSHSFKAHRVKEGGGYHVWHHEHSRENSYRILVWMLCLESPDEGGETEFLNQSMRITQRPRQLLIWPAGFTHKHRGNPPLKGQKTYLTGWFETVDNSDK
jgi:hypothetical protein